MSDDGFIKLVDLKTNTTSNLVNTADIKDVGTNAHIKFTITEMGTGTWNTFTKLVYLAAIARHEASFGKGRPQEGTTCA